METALYFPYMKVPQTPWFTQVLLYWDHAATIVPESRQREIEAENPYMSELAKTGLLKYVEPNNVIPYNREQEFRDCFLELLSDTNEPIPGSEFTKVHIDKLPHTLFGALASRGLAKYKDYDGDNTWWRVETKTADKYMAYLASVISGVRDYYPVTDNKVRMATLGSAANGDIEQRLSALRYVAITEALPVPQGPVKAADLLAFKDKHAEQLQNCRVRLDGKLADVAAIADDHLRKVKAAEVLREIHDDVAILQEDMNKRKWPKVLLVGVGGVAAAGLGIAGTVVTGGAALAVGLAVGSGAISAGAAGHKVIELIKMPRYDRHNPLAYAALSARL